MKASSQMRLKLTRLLEGLSKKPTYYGGAPNNPGALRELNSLSYEESLELARMFNELNEAIASAVLSALVNMGDSPEEIAKFRELCPKDYDIARQSDKELLIFRDGLRIVWEKDYSKLASVITEWFTRYRLDSPGWQVFPTARTFLPTKVNIRGMAVNICIQKRALLSRCSNPKCNRFFIAKRQDQKYCLEPECMRYAGALRSYKHWFDKKQGKKAKSPIRRKKAS